MTTAVLPDPATRFGARVRRRLRDEQVIWLVTVGADGTPQPNPVWFLGEDDSILVYNRRDAHRLAHIRRRPRVSLHFDSDSGGDIVVFSGTARILNNQPLAHEVPAYMAKYRRAAQRVSGEVMSFSAAYPIAVRIILDRVRGF